MAFDVSHLPEPVAARLRAFHRRKRFYGLCRVVALALIAWLVLAFVGVHIDRLWLLDDGTRRALTATVHGLTGLIALAALVRWWLRRPTVRQIAYELESRLAGGAEERLVTLDSLSTTDGRASANASEMHDVLMTQLRDSTAAYSATVSAGTLVRDPWLKRLAVGVVALLAVHGVLLLPTSYQYALMLRRLVQPGANLPRPSFVQVRVQPDTLVVGRGGEAVLQAEISGHIPAGLDWLMTRLGTATPACRILIAADPDDGSGSPDEAGTPVISLPWNDGDAVDMTRIQRTLYLHTESELQHSFSFRIRHGDALTAVHRVRVAAQPRIVRLAVTVQSPAYTALPEQTFESPGRGLSALPGSVVTVHFAVDQAVAVPTLLVDKTPLAPADPEDAASLPDGLTWDAATHTGSYTFTLTKALALEVRATNAAGFANVEKATVAIGVRDDQSPSIRLESPTGDVESVPGELVPLQVAVEDDLGIAEVAIRYQLNPQLNPDAPFQEISLDIGVVAPAPAAATEEEPATDVPATPAAPPVKSLALTPSFDLDQCGAVPGDEVLVQLRARDTAGNDGQSRSLMVRVVAFTRGENERHRLAALAFVGRALVRLSASQPGAATPASTATAPASATSSGFAVDPAAWAAVRKDAEALKLALPEAPSLTGLLDLLEREHHFTDAASDKTGVRHIYDDLHAIALGLMVDPPSTPRASPVPAPLAERNAALNTLGAATIPRAILQRRLLNLTWRLHGMRTEAGNIRTRLQDLAAVGDTAPEDAKRAVTRRAKLYLDTLQTLGDDLLSFADDVALLDPSTTTPTPADASADAAGVALAVHLDKASLLPIQGELNTAAYQLTRGSLGKRASAAEGVETQLDALLTRVHLAAGRMAALGVDRALTTSHTRLADAVYHQAVGPAAALARQWIDADARLLDREPFAAPATTMAARVRLDRAVRGTPEIVAEGPASPTAPPTASLPTRELTWAAWLVRDQERAALLALPLSPAERAFVDAQWPAPAAPPATDLLADYARNLAPLLTGSAALPPLSPSARLDALLANLDASQAALDALASAGADPDKLGPALDAANQGARAVPLALGELIDELAFQSRFVRLPLGEAAAIPGATANDDAALGADEALLLALRAARLRYQLMAAPSMTVFGDAVGHDLDAGALAQVLGELPRLATARAALRANLTKARANLGDGTYAKPEIRQTYPMLDLFARTRDDVATAAALRRTADPAAAADLAAAWLARHPEAGLDYLASRTADLDAARAALHDATAALSAEPADRAAYAVAAATVRERLQSLDTAAARAGNAEAVTELREAIGRVANQASRLDLPPDGDALLVRKRLYSLGELQPDLDRLARRLAADPQADADAGFRGGPDGIWDDATRYQAEESRRRLLAQMRHARRQVTLGILAGFDAAPTSPTTSPASAAQRHDATLAWALFLHRVVRSDLGGAVRTQPPRNETKRGGDRLVDWLTSELEESRKVLNQPDSLRDYPRVTKEYLDSMKDYLRY